VSDRAKQFGTWLWAGIMAVGFVWIVVEFVRSL
jgi:hypothetical protein